jgi:probable F420-dependent oxidoreductase
VASCRDERTFSGQPRKELLMAGQTRFGLALKNFAPEDEPLAFEDLAAYAERAEALGFSSLWSWDHMLLGSKRPFPFLESLSVLAALAARTSHVTLGTGILVLPIRNPVVLAKVLSTIDVISHGRLVLGAAAGWYEKEFEAVGIPFERRGSVLVRNVEVLKRFWTERAVSGEAEGDDGTPGALRFGNAVMLPKPVQQPRPPILLGGYVDVVLKRVARIADGWLTYLYKPDSFQRSWKKIQRYAEELGRDPGELRNVSQLPICVADSYEEAKRRTLAFVADYFDEPAWSEATADSAIRGTVEQCAEQLAEHVDVGVQEIALMPAYYEHDQVEVIGKELLPILGQQASGEAGEAR